MIRIRTLLVTIVLLNVLSYSVSQGCTFDIQCGFGGTCFKKPNRIHGFCIGG